MLPSSARRACGAQPFDAGAQSPSVPTCSAIAVQARIPKARTRGVVGL